MKAGLENEGLGGLGDSICEYGPGGADASKPVKVTRRSKYKKLKILLPRVLHKDGNNWRPIDYDRDILSAVNWGKFNGGDAVSLNNQDVIREIQTTVDIQGQGEVLKQDFDTGERLTLDYFVRRLIDFVPNPWQAARIAKNFIEQHKNKGIDDVSLLHNRVYLSEVLRRRLQERLDAAAESVFRGKVRSNEIRFHLETNERLDYALRNSFEVFVSSQEKSLQSKYGEPVQQSLFAPVYESDFNQLEKDFCALSGKEQCHILVA